jgi:hypothetical protein
MRLAFSFFFLFALGAMLSCTPKEEQVIENPNARLSFKVGRTFLHSGDTVKFDTLLTTRSSITRRLKVFNNQTHALNIHSIRLGNEVQSPYTIHVNGRPGYEFKNVFLPGRDSLLILIKITIDPEDKDLPFLVKDSIVFNTYQNQQYVKLNAWGQDAHFMGNMEISGNVTWEGERPYVITKSLAVNENASLTLEKGVRVYFDHQAKMIVNGTLVVNGEAEKPVLLRNARLDISYENAFNQWKGITFTNKSKGNIINFAKIRNAQTGILVYGTGFGQEPDVEVNNTVIENMSVAGLIGIGANIKGHNVLVNHCMEYFLLARGGGNYDISHATMINPVNYTRNNAVFEFLKGNQEEGDGNYHIKLYNSIIWAGREEEIRFDVEKNKLHLDWGYNVLKSRNATFKVNENVLYSGSISSLMLANPFIYDFRPEKESLLVDKAKPIGITHDLDGLERDSKPDIGAYEWREKKKEED